MAGPDEFAWIDRLRSLTAHTPGALGLMDDAAVIPSRPRHDLVISKDALVEGVHFLPGEARDVVARRLLRTNLSDLAAKGAQPFGYLLMTAWPHGHGEQEEIDFVRGLAQDAGIFGMDLLGGDTVFTHGPLTVSATVLGWVKSNTMIKRSGAMPGDLLMVTGAIGDGYLGLKAARGEIADADGALRARYRLPHPRLELRRALLTCTAAAADVSDGLLADALHLADASGCEVVVELERLPLSAQGQIWLACQEADLSARLALASGGDDYEIVCAVRPDKAVKFGALCAQAGVAATMIGRFQTGSGIRITDHGMHTAVADLGWRHR